MFLPTMPAWFDEATCAEFNPDTFYPEVGHRENAAEAKSVCAICPVREQCLAYALETDERWGIWGGLSERERRKLRRAS